MAERGRHFGSGVPSEKQARTLVLALWTGETTVPMFPLSSVDWPERVELALSTLVALEATLGVDANFDVHVAIAEDDTSQPGRSFGRDFHKCDSFRDWAVNADYRQRAVCDVHTLVSRARLPHTVIKASGMKLPRSLISEYDHVVVILGAGVLVSAAAIESLVTGLKKQQNLVLTPLSSASLSEEAGFLATLPRAARRYATHPLNFARTDEAVRRASMDDEDDVIECSLSSQRVFALESATLLRLMDEEAPFDWCAILEKATLRQHRSAYAFAAKTSAAEILLDEEAAVKPDDGQHHLSHRRQQHKRSKTLVAITCAGVWKRTLTALLSLEASNTDDFDLVVGVSPRGARPWQQADELEAAGIEVLRQPWAAGLTDLWNRVVRLALRRKYAVLVLSNNDVLFGPGGLSSLSRTIDGGAVLASAITNTGGANYYFFDHENEDQRAFTATPLSWKRTQDRKQARPPQSQWAKKSMLKNSPHVIYRLPAYTAFCFAIKTSWIEQVVFKTQNVSIDYDHISLWNESSSKNYGQETELLKRTRASVFHVDDAFVYHFRGATLPARFCQNGMKDCATWQKDHRPGRR